MHRWRRLAKKCQAAKALLTGPGWLTIEVRLIFPTFWAPCVRRPNVRRPKKGSKAIVYFIIPYLEIAKSIFASLLGIKMQCANTLHFLW